MASTNDYRLLRTKANLTDDTDYVGTQAKPAAADLGTVHPPNRVGHIVQRGVQLELVLEFLNASNAAVNGAASYTMRLIKVIDRGWLVPITEIMVQSVAVTVTSQDRVPVIIGDLHVGDEFSVRLTGITGPTSSTQVRVLYREVQG